MPSEFNEILYVVFGTVPRTLWKGRCSCGSCNDHNYNTAVAASLQDDTQRSSVSGIHALWSHLPHWVGPANVCDQWILWKWQWVTSKAAHKGTVVSFLLSLSPCSGQNQLPWSEAPQAALWISPLGEELPASLPAIGMSHLGSLNQALTWLCLGQYPTRFREKSWAGTTQPLPDSWSTETVSDNKCLLLF